jgi:threonine/homoserine/homoserine lactone efflux protein
MPDFLIIALTTFAAFMVGVGLTIGFASQVRRLVRSPKHVTTVNRSLSSILVIGGGLMALS